MTPTRMRSLSTVAALLLDAHRRATSARGASTALYLVRLTELAGLALAVAVHEATGGPVPTVLRERAVGAGVSKPVMAGAVALDALTRALEGLAVLGEADRGLLVTSLRGIHERGGRPGAHRPRRDRAREIARGVRSARTDTEPSPPGKAPDEKGTSFMSPKEMAAIARLRRLPSTPEPSHRWTVTGCACRAGSSVAADHPRSAPPRTMRGSPPSACSAPCSNRSPSSRGACGVASGGAFGRTSNRAYPEGRWGSFGWSRLSRGEDATSYIRRRWPYACPIGASVVHCPRTQNAPSIAPRATGITSTITIGTPNGVQ